MNQVVSIVILVLASLSFGCGLLILYIKSRLNLKRLFLYVAIFIISHSLDNILYSMMLFKQINAQWPNIELVIHILRFCDAFPLIFIMIDTGCIQRSRKIDFVIFLPLILFSVITISSPFYNRMLEQSFLFPLSLLQIIIKKLVDNLYIIFIIVGSGIYSFLYFYLYQRRVTSHTKSTKFLINTLFLYQVIERIDCLHILAESIPEYIFICLYTLCLVVLHYRTISFCIAFFITLDINISKQTKVEHKPGKNDYFQFSLYKKIVTIITEKQLYKNPELSLDDIANRVNVNRVLVSQAINNYCGENFNMLINRFRIKEMKKQFNQDENRSILEIGLDSGFNSRATMNRMFQKLEHRSPREYRESMINHIGQPKKEAEINVIVSSC